MTRREMAKAALRQTPASLCLRVKSIEPAADDWRGRSRPRAHRRHRRPSPLRRGAARGASTRSEENTSELQALMRISYAVLCLKKKRVQQRIFNIENRMTH